MKILIRAIVSFFVFIVDVVYKNRPYPRFYLLETIARVPYFSFLSVLHLDEFQTTPDREFRRPKVDNLYDVFMNIRDDESEHVKIMAALQQPAAQKTFHSPHTIVELMPVCEDKSEILAPNLRTHLNV